jgi:hypothetical protein
MNTLSTRGHNQPPDYAQEVTDRMAADYAEMSATVTAQLGAARDLPATVDGEEQLRIFSDQIVAMRDTAARAEATRKAEKEPYLRAGQAVDGFFSTLVERLNGGVKVLSKRVNDYQQKKLAEERQRRQVEADRLAREAAAKKAEEDRLAREAEDRRLAAERARNPEKIEEKSAIADMAEQAASTASIDAAIAAEQAEAAHIDTLRKPSDMARSRFDAGRLVTMKQVGYVEILDKMKLDAETLWPFVKEEHALQALKAWAKTTSHKRQMDGAVVEMRDETVVR